MHAGQQTPARGGDAPTGKTRLLFVCLGNICRSPTAEGVMRALVREAGLSDAIELDSAGTGSWHVGSPPDRRALDAARRRGIALSGLARQVRREDFEDFDLILAMDRENLRELHRLAPERARGKIRLLREFDPPSARAGRSAAPDPGDGSGGEALEVPDPYYGAPGGFDEVIDLVQAACTGLLARMGSGERV